MGCRSMMILNLIPLTIEIVIPRFSNPFALGQVVNLGVGSQTFKQPENLGVS